MTTETALQQAAAHIRAAKQIAVLTGAGVSKESGVPTFRNALDGLWSRYDPQQLATEAAFMRDPKLVWDWYEYRRGMVRQAQPNPGHVALAELQRRYPTLRIITQNVDDLHEQAGSTDVIRLHGNIAASKCSRHCQGSPTLVDVSQITWEHEKGPPPCPHCGSPLRPDVVWFGEVLPHEQLSRAVILAQIADVMLVVGTSGVVMPAAEMPHLAKRNGAVIIEVNPGTSEITALADIWLNGPSGEMLPRLLEVL
ncbi:MAG: NAD-dependent deacylase [Anaerolineae bacterium]|nr:NAD-dependent deacylase [Anaerolineae bacterium]